VRNAGPLTRVIFICELADHRSDGENVADSWHPVLNSMDDFVFKALDQSCDSIVARQIQAVAQALFYIWVFREDI
jgi:hypothetical protein